MGGSLRATNSPSSSTISTASDNGSDRQSTSQSSRSSYRESSPFLSSFSSMSITSSHRSSSSSSRNRFSNYSQEEMATLIKDHFRSRGKLEDRLENVVSKGGELEKAYFSQGKAIQALLREIEQSNVVEPQVITYVRRFIKEESNLMVELDDGRSPIAKTLSSLCDRVSPGKKSLQSLRGSPHREAELEEQLSSCRSEAISWQQKMTQQLKGSPQLEQQWHQVDRQRAEILEKLKVNKKEQDDLQKQLASKKERETQLVSIYEENQ